MEPTVDQLSEFGKIGIFLILGALFVMGAYGISYLLSKSKPSPGKLSTYECGEEPEGSAHIQFNNRFYVIALVFLVFDVEIVFLFPWSAVFAREAITAQVPLWGWLSFGEMIIFVCVLLVGLVYVWMKGDLAWVRPQPLVPVMNTQVPAALYAAINAEQYTVREFRLPEPPPVRPAAATATGASAAPTSGTGAAKPGTPRFKPGAARFKPGMAKPATAKPATSPEPENQEAVAKQQDTRPENQKSETQGQQPETPPKAAKPAFKPRILKKKD